MLRHPAFAEVPRIVSPDLASSRGLLDSGDSVAAAGPAIRFYPARNALRCDVSTVAILAQSELRAMLPPPCPRETVEHPSTSPRVRRRYSRYRRAGPPLELELAREQCTLAFP